MFFRKLIYLICLPAFCFGQTESNKSMTLIDVNLAVNGVLFDRLDPNNTNTQLKLFESLLEHRSVTVVKTALSDTRAIYLQPSDTLKGLVAYNSNDLPDPLSAKSAIKKLAKKGFQTNHFLQLNLACRIESDVIGKSRLLKRVKPIFEVIITLFDDKGKLVQKVTTRAIYKEFIDAQSFDKDGFSRKRKAHIEKLNQLLQPLLSNTINRAVEKIKL